MTLENKTARYTDVMKREIVLCLLFSALCLGTYSQPVEQPELPGDHSPIPAIEFTHFPSRMHAFIWRNWTTVPALRLAEVLNTTVENVEKIALSMGLERQKGIDPIWSGPKGYITVLRHNWHLLPYEQLLVLLGMSRQELAWRLIEDDFLFVKLGQLKPYCTPLYYREPSLQMQQQAASISNWLRELDKVIVPETARFAFTRDMSSEESGWKMREKSNLAIRMAFSYFAEFGDPLKDPEISSYPDFLLKRLSEKGINAVWVHTVLRTLVPPSGILPGDEDYAERIGNLNKLVQRADRYGIKVYLYVNEPRAMPEEFFDSQERKELIGVKGGQGGDLYSLCTSNRIVHDWLRDSFEKVFSSVPGLGGVFTITASENLTNCASHGRHTQCGRCKELPYDKIIAEVNRAIFEGVKKGNPAANVLVYDWGWDDNQAEKIIRQLPKDAWLMSVSEWSLPIERGGIESRVGEYSISSVGPGPRALQYWKWAREAGLKIVAKIQVNTSWELGSVPLIPAMDLIAEHARNLSDESIDGIMFSWSVGGYPSKNMALFQEVFNNPQQADLVRFAARYYDKKSAPHIRNAWHCFSSGFAEYPYHIGTLYNGPQHMGAANLFHTRPTGYKATMVGLPYDDLASWRAIYPTDTWIGQIRKVAEGFEQGYHELGEALSLCERKNRTSIRREMELAKVIHLHFSSVATQATFIRERDKYLEATEEARRLNSLKIMEECVRDEMLHVKELLPLVLRNPAIGYEASNQYFYIPQDLKEKYINLNYTLKWIEKEREVHSYTDSDTGPISPAPGSPR